MSENLNDILIKKISNSIPENKKVINYLMDILNIGRESMYRRMRGSIPFTFEEAVKLSLNLNFSIDEIIGSDTLGNAVLSDSQYKDLSIFDKYFYLNHLKYYNMIESISKANEMEILITLNSLTPFLVIDFDHLFKFYYYMRLNQSGGISLNSTFSEIEVPSPIVQIRQNIKSKVALIKNVSFILDQHIIMKLVQDIQYYYNRRLIPTKELNEIKNDMINLIDNVEKYIQTSANNRDSFYHFYLSLLNVDMNSVYGTFDGNTISQYWSSFNNSVNTGFNKTTAIHLNWIHSLKRSSVLISQSNEIVQASFLNQQRKLIETITNDLFFYYG